MQTSIDRPLAAPLRATDLWFRAVGLTTLVLLAATAASLALEAGDWRVVFSLAHLAALLALTPLGVVLVARAYLEARRVSSSSIAAVPEVVRRYPHVTALVLLTFTAGTVSLSQFDDGERWLRTAANLTTVTIVLLLVARYLRWSRGRV